MYLRWLAEVTVSVQDGKWVAKDVFTDFWGINLKIIDWAEQIVPHETAKIQIWSWILLIPSRRRKLWFWNYQSAKGYGRSNQIRRKINALSLAWLAANKPRKFVEAKSKDNWLKPRIIIYSRW